MFTCQMDKTQCSVLLGSQSNNHRIKWSSNPSQSKWNNHHCSTTGTLCRSSNYLKVHHSCRKFKCRFQRLSILYLQLRSQLLLLHLRWNPVSRHLSAHLVSHHPLYILFSALTIQKSVSSECSRSDHHGCSMCNKQFTRADVLKKHLKTSHLTANCAVCGEMFDDKVALAKHQVEVQFSNFFFERNSWNFPRGTRKKIRTAERGGGQESRK